MSDNKNKGRKIEKEKDISINYNGDGKKIIPNKSGINQVPKKNIK